MIFFNQHKNKIIFSTTLKKKIALSLLHGFWTIIISSVQPIRLKTGFVHNLHWFETCFAQKICDARKKHFCNSGSQIHARNILIKIQTGQRLSRTAMSSYILHQVLHRAHLVSSSFSYISLVAEADMENIRNFIWAGLFISRFYPKVCELHQFQNCDKTA